MCRRNPDSTIRRWCVWHAAPVQPRGQPRSLWAGIRDAYEPAHAVRCVAFARQYRAAECAWKAAPQWIRVLKCGPVPAPNHLPGPAPVQLTGTTICPTNATRRFACTESGPPTTEYLWITLFQELIQDTIWARRTNASDNGLRRRETPRRDKARAQLRHRAALPIFIARIDPLIDRRNLLYPTPPLGVLQIEHRIRRPVKVICDEGYLPVQRFQGVA